MIQVIESFRVVFWMNSDFVSWKKKIENRPAAEDNPAPQPNGILATQVEPKIISVLAISKFLDLIYFIFLKDSITAIGHDGINQPAQVDPKRVSAPEPQVFQNKKKI